MTRYSKFNIIYRLQKWMDSVPGQTFLNYAYSWGASIVILGTLFKLTHLPGANFFLFLGMGTEVFVFFISAFDRPFDKTADGMELDLHPGEETPSATVIGGNGGTVIINGNGSFGTGGANGSPVTNGSNEIPVSSGSTVIPVASGSTVIPVASGPTGIPVASGINETPVTSGKIDIPVQPRVDTEAIAAVSTSVASVSGGSIGTSALPQMTPELEEATSNYVDELKRLTEMLSRVSEQSEKLAHDSEEMENLNRTLTGICKVYELQLKSASSQIGTIDEINEQTRKMAAQIADLNRIYARMIEAMTAKMNV